MFRTPEMPAQIVKTGDYGTRRPRICACCYSLIRGTGFDDISVPRDRQAEAAELFRGARCRTRFPVTDAVGLADDTPGFDAESATAHTARQAAVLRVVKDDNTAWVQRVPEPAGSHGTFVPFGSTHTHTTRMNATTHERRSHSPPTHSCPPVLEHSSCSSFCFFHARS